MMFDISGRIKYYFKSNTIKKQEAGEFFFIKNYSQI